METASLSPRVDTPIRDSAGTSGIHVALVGPFSGMAAVPGGVQQQVKNLILRLREFRFDIVTLVEQQGYAFGGTLPNHVRLTTLPRAPLPMTLAGPSLEAKRIADIVRRIKPDIVHVQTAGAPYGAAGLLLARRFPVVLTVHTTMSQRRKFSRGWSSQLHDKLWEILERRQVRTFPVVLAVSANVAEALKRMGAREVRVAPNGVGDEWFDLEDRSIPGRILFAGRLVPQKGLEYLLAAAKILREREIEYTLHIVGPGLDRRYEKFLRTLIDKGNLWDQIRMESRLLSEEELLKEHEEASIFALPSLEESHPIGLLQAMAASKAIVATRVGGIPELISDGKNGVLVNPRDPRQLAEALEALLRNPAVGKALGRAARRTASSFSWADCAKETRKAYMEALSASGSRSSSIRQGAHGPGSSLLEGRGCP